REAVRVRLEGRTLIVSGRRTPPQEPHDAHYHRAEIYFGAFERALELPWEADPKGIEAIYRDGMLEIRIRAATNLATKDVAVPRGAARGARRRPRPEGGPRAGGRGGGGGGGKAPPSPRRSPPRRHRPRPRRRTSWPAPRSFRTVHAKLRCCRSGRPCCSR